MSRSTEPPISLCETCRNLDITAEKFVISPDDPSRAIRQLQLGTLNEVRNRAGCILCSYVAERIQASLPVGEQQAKRIKYQLEWRTYGRYRSDRLPVVDRARQLFLFAGSDVGEMMPDIQLSLLAEDAPEPDFHGRRIPKEQIDFNLVKTWLLNCLLWHGAECEKPVTENLSPPWDIPDIRLIDVEQMCLVKMAKGCQYVTLSYVWGSIPTLMATRENIMELEKPGKLQRLASEVPNTIRDAIDVTAKIGQRFLWVDRLCIVQDDEAHLQAHIWNMERIYGDSVLLIIAADGDNAESGLLGVRPGTRDCQQTILPIKSTLRLVTTQVLEVLRGSTTYEHRAWTLQEEFFARRKLIFVGGQVFFECREARWQEDVVLENPRLRTKDRGWGRLLPPAEGLSVFLTYSQIVHNYTSRRLTWELDILDAFAGISNYWAEKFGATMKYGLPNAAFDWALLWEPQEPLSNRELGASTFPSWSWAGWKGCVSIHPPTNDSSLSPRGMQQWLTHHTWIVWYQWSASLNTLLWDVIRERKNKPWRERAHIGYRCTNSVDPFGRSSHRFVIDGKSQEEMSWSLRGPDALDDPAFESSQMAVSGQLLLFWTVSARFCVGQLSKQEQSRHKIGAFAVLDRRGVASGYVIPDRGILAVLPAVLENNNKVELILLSDSSSTSMTDKQYDKAVENAEALEEPPTASKTMVIIDSGPQIDDAETWNLYHVMLIEWRDQVAVRKGIGKIYKRAIQYALDPGPVWKSILLG